MTTLTDNEINHLIATKINGWVHAESNIYLDANDAYCCLADYCNSIAHALDLARAAEVGLAPTKDGWSSYSVANPDVSEEDTVPGKAICLCILKMNNIQAVEPQTEASN